MSRRFVAAVAMCSALVGMAAGSTALDGSSQAHGAKRSRCVQVRRHKPKPKPRPVPVAAVPPAVVSPPVVVPLPAPVPPVVPDPPAPAPLPPAPPAMKLVRDYQFAGATLPPDWTAATGSFTYAATTYQPSQVSPTGTLTAIPAGNAYQSGWMWTQNAFTFTYGRVDFHVQVPSGQGLWAAMWLLSVTGGTEIDVSEILGGRPTITNGSLHAGAAWNITLPDYLPVDLSAGVHDYGVLWEQGSVTWLIDGVPFASYTKAEATLAGRSWPFDGASLYLIANLAVAGPSEWGGPPDASTVFPAVMQVQSVQVYQ